MLKIKSVMLFVISAVLCAGAFAERQWPEAVFACQVVTTSGAQGLVNIQSLSRQEAETGVVGLTAITLAQSNGVAARVVQCIEESRGQSFTDSSFQAWYKKLDK